MKESIVAQHIAGFFGIKWLTWDDKKWLVLLAGLAILVRLAYVLMVGKTRLAWGDEITYNQLAEGLVRHSCYCFVPGYPSVWRPPLYPLILASIYFLFGQRYMIVLIFQALVGGLSAPLLTVVGKQISGSLGVGVLAGLMMAFHPVVIFATGLLYSETIYVPLLLLMAYGWLKLIPPPRNWVALSLGTGLLLGLSVLMRPNLMFFPAWLLIWGWVVSKNFVWAVKTTGYITVAMALTIVPWTMRNYAVTGELVLVSANSGLNLWQGNHPQADGGALDIQYIDPLPQLSEKGRDDVYWQWGMDWLRAHPWDFFHLALLKLYKFFSPLETSNRGQLFTRIAPVILSAFGLYYLTALVGMVATAKQLRKQLLAYFLIAYPALLAIVFYGGTRYGLVVQPFIMLFAAEGAVAVFSRLRPLKARA